MPERASLQEVKDFANKVRNAGGGNPLDALMPAVPEDPSACLIAKNLNFNCNVEGGGAGWERATSDKGVSIHAWIMIIESEETRDKIADALGLEPITKYVKGYGYGSEREEYAVILPDHIGAVAEAFDKAGEYLNEVIMEADEIFDYTEDENLTRAAALKQALEQRGQSDRALLGEMVPYIVDAVDEAYNLATAVNDRGEILL